MADKSKSNRKDFHPHENNIDTKIQKGNTDLAKFKTKYYKKFVKEISKINFESRDIKEFEKAGKLIDEYYASLSEFASTNGINAHSGIKSSFIEEISKYLFINHPIVVREKLFFFNKSICTGMFFSKETIKTTTKDVDFCICKEIKMKFGNDNLIVKVPIICVECKTYLDGTMFNEVIDTATRIHSSSPDAHNFVFMLWNEVGKDTFTIRRKATNISEFFSFIKKPHDADGKSNINIDAKVLLEYYDAVSGALEEYYKEYIYPDFGRYLH